MGTPSYPTRFVFPFRTRYFCMKDMRSARCYSRKNTTALLPLLRDAPTPHCRCSALVLRRRKERPRIWRGHIEIGCCKLAKGGSNGMREFRPDFRQTMGHINNDPSIYICRRGGEGSLARDSRPYLAHAIDPSACLCVRVLLIGKGGGGGLAGEDDGFVVQGFMDCFLICCETKKRERGRGLSP